VQYMQKVKVMANSIFAKELNIEDYVECPACKGSGSQYEYDIDSRMATLHACPICNGLGHIEDIVEECVLKDRREEVKANIGEKESENTPCPCLPSTHCPQHPHLVSHAGERLPSAPHQALPPQAEELSDMLRYRIESRERFLDMIVNNCGMYVEHMQLEDELYSMNRIHRFLSFRKRKRLRKLEKELKDACLIGILNK